MLKDTTWDKIGVGLDAILLGTSMRGRQQGGFGGAPATSVKGGLATIAELVAKAYREGGSTLLDEALILEQTFGANPMDQAQFIEKLETEKVAALMKILEDWERFNLRLELLHLETEVVKISTPGGVKKGDDGKPEMGDDGKPKKVATTTREEKSKVNRRVNVLKGIAAHIDDEMSEESLKHVATMMRDIGALGDKTRSQRLMEWAKNKVDSGKIAAFFGLSSLDDITYKVVEAKLAELLGPLPDTSQPRPKDNAGMLLRFGRVLIPGSFPNSPRAPRAPQRLTGKGIYRIVIRILVGIAISAVLVSLASPFIHKKYREYQLHDIINQPINSAEMPK